jgi:CBS domain-containing protein
VTCTPDESLAAVLDKLVSHHIHRCYVVDERGRPLGVVTMTDVLRVVVESQPEAGAAPAPAKGAFFFII